MDDMKDKNGKTLRVGDTIHTSMGTCRLQAYLGPELLTCKGMGARVRVITASGRKVDTALLLVKAEYIPPPLPDTKDERTTPAKYGM